MNTKIAYKAFNPDFTCLDFQYEVGKSYKHDGIVEACASGFYSCEYPLDVFSYYKPSNLVLAEVSVSGDIKTHERDSKLASSEINIIKEISFNELATAAVEYITKNVSSEYSESGVYMTSDKSVATNTGRGSVATNTGDKSAATNTGCYSVASNTGSRSAATNTGYSSVATNTGYYSVATNTGNKSAATNTGDNSAATNTGNNSVATNTGNCSTVCVSGSDGVAVATGRNSKAKASEGSAIVLFYRDDKMKIVHYKCAMAGVDIKPDTYYTLSETGEFVECAINDE